jgi:hypothetical protein
MAMWPASSVQVIILEIKVSILDLENKEDQVIDYAKEKYFDR